jgi:hypothetical protein
MCMGLALQNVPGLQYWVSDDFGRRINPTSQDETQAAFDFEPLGGHQYFLNVAYMPGITLPGGREIGITLYTSQCGSLFPLNQLHPDVLEPPAFYVMPLQGPTLTPSPTSRLIISLTPSLTPIPASCSSHPDYSACKSAGCSWWWSDNACHSDPEPPPMCSTYTDNLSCEGAGCSWWMNSTCHEEIDPCLAYNNDQSACEKAACSWDSKDNSCHTP